MNTSARLTALGFAVVDTGGGCTAWRMDLRTDGVGWRGYILITDAGGCSADIPTEATPICIGLYDLNDDCVVIATDDCVAPS